MSRADFIKKANEETEYTTETILELDKCQTDPEYFIINYCKIQHPVKGAIPFALYDYQKRLLDGFKNHQLNIVLSARQTGKCVDYYTKVETIKKPVGLKKIILFLIDRQIYDGLFN